MRALFAALLLGFAGAAAQNYQILQGTAILGKASVQTERTVTGYVLQGSAEVRGAFSWQSSLRLNAAYRPTAYTLTGKVRGTSVKIRVAFKPDNIEEAVEQGGKSQSINLPTSGPVYLVDNNLMNGWQALLLALDYRELSAQRFRVLIPQVASLGWVSFKVGKQATHPAGGKTYTAYPVEAALEFGSQTIHLNLWAEVKTHTLLGLFQQQGRVRFLLSVGKAEAPANPLAARFAGQEHCFTSLSVKVNSAGATLYGSLTLPKGPGPFPALLLIPGSGPVDQNGNVAGVLMDNTYKQLAHELSCNGYGVLRYNKPGLAPSTGDGNRVTLETYAENVAAWFKLLASTARIDPTRLALMGHSEGGLIALFAAKEGYVHPAALVLLESPGLPFTEVVKTQMVFQAGLKGESSAQIKGLKALVNQTFSAIEAGTSDTLELKGALAENPLARLFAHAAGLLRSEAEEDPARLIQGLDMPILIVQGGADIQVLPENGRSLHLADPNAGYVLIPKLTHGLVRCTQSLLACALPTPGEPLDNTFVTNLGTWLNTHLKEAR